MVVFCLKCEAAEDLNKTVCSCFLLLVSFLFDVLGSGNFLLRYSRKKRQNQVEKRVLADFSSLE